MDTNSLKRFSAEARVKLKTGVAMMMQQLGFDAEGHAASMPERIGGGAILNGAVISDDRFYDRWMSLYHAIQLHGVREVYEEVAYTWFNRFIAIRIMRMNGFISPVLEYQSQDVRIPCIVANARRGIIPPMPEQDRRRLDDILLDDSKTSEQFAILIVAYCHNNPVLSRIFGRVNDYTALLLPGSILAPGDFVDMLNNTPFIKPEDYKQSELIGWLYQFYISEKKNEVSAALKNGSKAEAEDIPAATQFFTPNWIVKYMVQNTLGRIYLDNNPGSPLEDKWKHIVPLSDNANDAPKLKIQELEELTLLDPGSGSGHILVEGFDMLYDMYTAEFASPREACEAILTKNITGIDIDTRAKQLAQFSLLMKACQKDDSFLDAKILPRVYDMPEPWEDKAGLYELLKRFFARDDSAAIKETIAAITLMDQAKNLGSIMKFGLSERTRFLIARRMEELLEEHKNNRAASDLFELVPYLNIIHSLSKDYAVIAANPPYMGSGNMNEGLKEYVNSNYTIGRADLFSVFMFVAVNHLRENGKLGMINMQSWMFLTSFESLRKEFIDRYQIDSMVHLGPHAFDEIGGEVVQSTVFVLSNIAPKIAGNYFRVVDYAPSCKKEEVFLNLLSPKVDVSTAGTRHEDHSSLHYCVAQERFKTLPGSAFGYWASDRLFHIFQSCPKFVAYSELKSGIMTGNDAAFIRFWFEPSLKNESFSTSSYEEYLRSNLKWFPLTRGGDYRKWYGNLESVVNIANRGYDIRNSGHNFRLRDSNYYFLEGFAWTMITTRNLSIRYVPNTVLFGNGGPVCFPKEHLMYLFAFLNSKIVNAIIAIINPTINKIINDIENLPVLIDRENEVEELTKKCVIISKLDWDQHETSWDFQENEILGLTTEKYTKIIHGLYEGTVIPFDLAAPELDSLEWRVRIYKQKWEDMFRRLHANEEELNRLFIEIYGLQDELTPDVPLEGITILKQDVIRIQNNQISWNEDVIIKQLISYILGCYMGRYRLDRPGLAIAYPDAADDEKAPYQIPGTSATFHIDDDALIPLLPSAAGFADNGVQLVRQTIMDVLGSENFATNLNFIENCLGKSLEDYMAKDFWNDHKKMYQNRPIYWLFSSKKGAFKVVAYMHRMTKYTVEQVRQNYLLPYIDKLKGQAVEIQAKGAGASSSERRSLQGLLKNIAECEEYHTRLHSVAEKQISFDLDDGVIKNYALFGDILAKIK